MCRQSSGMWNPFCSFVCWLNVPRSLDLAAECQASWLLEMRCTNDIAQQKGSRIKAVKHFSCTHH